MYLSGLALGFIVAAVDVFLTSDSMENTKQQPS